MGGSDANFVDKAVDRQACPTISFTLPEGAVRDHRHRKVSPVPQGTDPGAARFRFAGSNPVGPPRSHQGGAQRASNRHVRRVVL